MSDEFVGVVADTTALWLCGASYIPLIAESLESAGSNLANTALHDGAFEFTSSGPHGSFGTVGATGAAFTQLRDELQNIVAASVTNIFEVGDALERVAWAYETTDGNNATGLLASVEYYLDDDYSGPRRIWTDEDRDELMPPTPTYGQGQVPT